MSELQTLHDLIDALPEYGNRPAVVALQKEEVTTWSYHDLADHVQRLAAGLRQAGIDQNSHVALLAANRPEWIIACLAVIKAGGVAAPVDVQAGDETVKHILTDSECRFVFTTRSQARRLEELGLEDSPEFIFFDAEAGDSHSWQEWLADDDRDLPQADPAASAVLFYTSGTTGPPKGAPLTHRNLVFQINAIIQAGFVTGDDRLVLPLPLHHVYPFAFGMLAPLSLGMPIILPYALTGPQIIRALDEGQATIIIGVPRLYRALYEGIESQAQSGGVLARTVFKAGFGLSMWLRRRLGLRLGKRLLSPLHQRFGPSLRVLASGGSALDPDLAWKLEGLGWQVGIGYGLTETAPLLTLNTPGKIRIGSVGQPLAGVEIRLDPAARPGAEEAATAQGLTGEANQEGEILAKGPNLFAGYRRLPDKTAEVFTEDGRFRTGDLGYFDQDGYLYITGRVSTVIVTESGKNIQPDEVEAAYEESPLIAEVGVLQDEGRLVALIVPELSELRRRGTNEIEAAIREDVENQSRQLPSYERIADFVLTRESLPRTRLGKIRRHLLAERYEQAGREDEALEETLQPISIVEMSAEDRTLLEEPIVREVWDWLAERFADRRLTPDTSLQLDLNVDSLEWLNLTLELSQRTGVELSDEAIMRIDAVRDLLHEVAEAGEVTDRAPLLEAPEAALSEEDQRWLEPWGPVQAVAARLMYALNRLLLRLLFRLRVEGLENLPETGPFMITPNHRSYLDALIVAAALNYDRLRNNYWAGAATVVFWNPLLRLISRLSHTVPIDSERRASSSLAFGAAILERGHSLVWFPEGRRSLSGEMEPFKAGIGILLDHFRVPVVPTYIHCSREALAPGSKRLHFQPITIVFGPPLHPDDLESQGQGEAPYQRITAALQEHVAELGRQPAPVRC